MKAIAIVALFAVIGTGSALQCFECNSEVDESCSDHFYAVSSAIQDAFLVTCNETTNSTDEVFCRKTEMWFEVSGEIRVHRDCGYQRRELHDCYSVRAEDYVKDVCQCDEDSCNSAGRFVPMSTASGALVAAVVAAALARLQ